MKIIGDKEKDYKLWYDNSNEMNFGGSKLSEELYQKKSLENMVTIGEYKYLNIGNTTFQDLSRSNIIVNKVKEEFLKKKPDGLVLSGIKEPYQIKAIVEYKDPKELKTKNQRIAAIKQVSEYCWATQTHIGAITNGSTFYWFNISSEDLKHDEEFNSDIYGTINVNKIIDSNGDAIITNDFTSDRASQLTVIEIIKSIGVSSSVLNSEKVMTDPTPLAKKVWQSIWLATGDDPKKCLMTFTEIFMYKYLSDLEVIVDNDEGIGISFENTYQKGEKHCLKFYQNTVRTRIKELFPAGEDNTSIINGLSLKADNNQDKLFFDILTQFRAFGSLKGVSIEFKSSLFEEFLKGTNGIKLMAQFFTPRNIVRSITEMAQVTKLTRDQTVCDPACGVGGFIQETMIKRGIENEFNFENDNFSSLLKYSGYDLDAETITLAKASLTVLLSNYIAEASEINYSLKKISKYLNEVFKSYHSSSIGSLSSIDKKYDLIISNPPYVRKGLSVYHSFIHSNTSLNEYYDVSVSSKEGLFLINIIKSLKSGGKAFVILPDGFFHTKSDRSLRNFVIEECIIDGIISLPARTFYTTPKKTYILCITKKNAKRIKQTSKVFNYIVTDVGESLDANRVNTSLNDLNTLEIEFKKFYFDKINYKSDMPQVFLMDIDYYKENNLWMSDMLVSKGIRKELNLEVEDVVTSYEDLETELEDISGTIKQMLADLKVLDKEAEKFEQYNFLDVPLNENDFKFSSKNLGLKQKEYIPMRKEAGIPVYTAASKPVAFFDLKNSKKRFPKALFNATKDDMFISVATDGDGTAGTNIILHKTPFYLNTSRIAFKVLNKNIETEYVYYAIKDIKKRFGFGYTIKSNRDNLISYIEISIPTTDDGEYSREKQIQMIENMRKREKILFSLNELYDRFNHLIKFGKYSSINNI